MRKISMLVAVLGLWAVLLTPFTRADTLVLKDGTQLQGKVVPQADKYWIKTDTGESKMIPKAEVSEWKRGAAGSATPAAPTPAAPASPAGAPAASPTAGASAAAPPSVALDFASTKSKADRVDAPLVAIGLWQNFIDGNPKSPDLATAKTELAKWQQLDKDHAEKINGKWVGGEDRKKLIQKVNDLLHEANAMEGGETLKAVSKLEEAVKIYPNSYEANYELGFFYLMKAGTGSVQKHDQAIKSLETATKLRPNSAAAWSNLGIAYNFRQRYQDSVKACYKAATLKDTKEIAQNLVNSIAQAPPAMRSNSDKVRTVMEEATVLAHKYGIADGKQNWIFIRRTEVEASDKKGDADVIDVDNTPGVIGNGSGFLVSADGFILTNRHVASEKNCTFMCRFSDGTQKPAEVIAIDDDADIALMKIKDSKPFPFLKLSEANEPGVGAECAALGFPIGSVMHYTMQVTAGTVSSVSPSDRYPVTLTAKITHGNSGGPLVDKYGNVIGIVSAGLTAYSETYGKALSCEQIRKFLDKNKDKFPVALVAGATKDKLDTEGIYKQASPATMCILLVRGEPKAGE
jgi:S1-C subfamily serine protease